MLSVPSFFFCFFFLIYINKPLAHKGHTQTRACNSARAHFFLFCADVALPSQARAAAAAAPRGVLDHPRDFRAADDSLAGIVFYSLLLILIEVCRTILEMFVLQMTRWQILFSIHYY